MINRRIQNIRGFPRFLGRESGGDTEHKGNVSRKKSKTRTNDHENDRRTNGR